MRLLTGPAGSGKTEAILEELRAALRAGEAQGVRLLVPTATLAQHLQNEIAREGFLFPPRTVQTLYGFVSEWVTDAVEASEPLFCLLVEQAARRVNRAEFEGVVDFPGFHSSLARTIRELSAAGCDSARLEKHLPPRLAEAPLMPALLAIYREVEGDLERRGMALRARRLEIAAGRMAENGIAPVRTVWFDGFHALPAPELAVIAAIARHARVTVALSDFAADGIHENLERLGFRAKRMAARRARPATIPVKAPNIERETEEIARRILEHAAAGRPFREMGVVVRSAENYEAILRSTLARFGIPARFYFPARLEDHAAARFLAGVVEALVSGWDHSATLKALRLAPRFADSNEIDRFDFDVRERMPNRGLNALRALAGDAERVQEALARFEELDDWRDSDLSPREWRARFQTLRKLFVLARPREDADAVTARHNQALIDRGQAEALNAWDEAAEDAAESLPAETAVPLKIYWRAVRSSLRLRPLRVRDGRRNTVQVMSAQEARQWTLAVVFVCGLTERQFPQFHRPDAFLPEGARLRLNAGGIRVRTAAAFEAEERGLFEAAVSRGSSQVVLSYPEFDGRGERNLRSIFLDDLHLPDEGSRAVRPRPRSPMAPMARGPIGAPPLIDFLRQRNATLSPSALESYLQCAFQYFGTRTLRLKPAPKRPEQRLNENYLLQGEIVHGALKAAYSRPDRMEQAFEEEFETALARLNIPNGYHTERLRNAMREDLKRFIADTTWPRAEFQSETEQEFEFPLSDSLRIKGRIDRIDKAADGRSYVIDYKYSAAQRTKGRLDDPNLMQAPLYYLAAIEQFGLKPDGMFYVGLKKSVEYVGWSNSGFLGSEPIAKDWLDKARARTAELAEEIRAGRIAVEPFDRDNCRFCDCKDVCRVTAARGIAIAAGEEGE